MAAKIRNAIVLYRPLVTSGAQICLHSTVLYNSIYRADGEMLINQHIYSIASAYAQSYTCAATATTTCSAPTSPASNASGPQPSR